MDVNTNKVRDYARIALAIIRLFNGAAALFTPAWLIRRLGVDPKTSPTTFYPLRMFGIRTILIGVDLLSADDQTRAHALRVAPVIHASDTLGVMLAGVKGHLSKRAAITTTIISSVNTILAVIAQPRNT
jgi:hypothetical protein